MSQVRVNKPLIPVARQEATVAIKSHRVQTRKPSEIASLVKLHIQEDGAAKETTYLNLSELPRVGILKGAFAYENPYVDTDDVLKHLVVVYLYTVLRSPTKWTPETFAEIVELESTIANARLESMFPIRKGHKMYNIHLSSTLVKGRIGVTRQSSKQVRLDVHQALARIQRGKAAIWKCDSHFFLIRRMQVGWYFYTTNLQQRPTLLFFNCPRLMVNVVLMTFGCTERSKYFLSNVALHSVEEDDVARIVWKAKRSVGMQLVSPLEALLHGNIYLVRPILDRSLEIGLNVLDCVEAAQMKPRSWDNRTLNGCFKRSPATWKAAEKIARFLRDRNEPTFAAGPYNVTCRTSPIGHRQRKHFEEVVNYFLASCTALVVVGLDCCFLLWTRDHFIYWFSPYRYSTLQEQPAVVQNRACFLHMTNVLAKASESLYEYLYELGVFPDHTIELLPLRVDESRCSSVASSSEDDDSLDQEGLTIAPAGEQGWRNFYTTIGHSPSQLRLARQMLDMVYRTAADRCE